MHTMRQGLNDATGIEMPVATEADKRRRVYWSDDDLKVIATETVERRIDPANLKKSLLELLNDAIAAKMPPHLFRQINTISAVPELYNLIEKYFRDMLSQPVKEVVIEKLAPPKPEKTVREFSTSELVCEVERRKEAITATLLDVAAILIGKAPMEVRELVKGAQQVTSGEKVDRAKRIGLVQFAVGQIDTLKRMTPNHEDDLAYIPSMGNEKARLFGDKHVDIFVMFKPRTSEMLRTSLKDSESLKGKVFEVNTLEQAKVLVLDYLLGKSLENFRPV